MTAEKGTALHIAVMKGNADIVHILLNNNAAPFLEDQLHTSPIELCNNEVVKNLLKNYESKAKNLVNTKELPLSFSGEVWFSAQ